MLSRTLKMAFWVFHDHVGKLIVVSFIWATAVSAPLSVGTTVVFGGPLSPASLAVGVGCGYFGVFFCAPVAGAGIAHLIKILLEKRDGGLSDFIAGVRMHWGRAAGLGAIFAVATTMLSTSVWFYASKFEHSAPLIGYGISALAGWGLLVVGLCALMVLPSLVQRKMGVFATLKLTATLELANVGLTFGIAVQVALLTAVTALVWPFFFLGYPAVVLTIAMCAYELLARKYDGSGLADTEDDYLNRGLRDLVAPWKG